MPKLKPEFIIEKSRSLMKSDESYKLYAILDAARNRKIYHVLDPDNHRDGAYILNKENRAGWFPELPWFQNKCRCIYPLKNVPTVLLKASPYLVQLDLNNEFSRWLFRDGWGDSWGIFFTSKAQWDDLCGYYKRLLLAEDEYGEQIYLRYYDPRVFRTYIKTCNRFDLDVLFKFAEFYLVERDDGDSMDIYSSDHGRLHRESAGRIPDESPSAS